MLVKRIFSVAAAQMIATMNQLVLLQFEFRPSARVISQTFWPTKETCVPPRTDSPETLSSNGKIRCGLVHDHVLLRQGLRRLLEDELDIEVVSEASNAAECLRKVHELRPDVVVADSATFGSALAEAELLVARESPHTRIVFLNFQEQASAPFRGFAVRQTSAGQLIEMVRSACPKDRTAYPEAPPRSVPQHPIATLFSQDRALTAREREVLKLVAEGKTVRAAAAILGLSVKTVDAHKFNLMRKLGIHNKAELVMWAIQRKVVKVPVNF
jgi:two-component system, NarL family, response regulator NreC